MTRRVLAAAMVAVGLVALTGCRVEGRIAVQSEHTIEIDVTVHGRRSPYCNGDLDGLTTIPGRDPDGVVISCRYIGTVDPAVFGNGEAVVADAGEYRAVTFNPLQASEGQPPAIQNDVEAIDVTIAMPGGIVEANGGSPAGAQVRITDPAVLERAGGLRVLSLNHAGPSWTVWWGVGGLAAGVLGTLFVMALWRDRRPVDDRDADAFEGADDDRAGAWPPEPAPASEPAGSEPARRPLPAAPSPPPDPSKWAPD